MAGLTDLREYVVRSMANAIVSSGIDPSDEKGVTELLHMSGFTTHSVAMLAKPATVMAAIRNVNAQRRRRA